MRAPLLARVAVQIRKAGRPVGASCSRIARCMPRCRKGFWRPPSGVNSASSSSCPSPASRYIPDVRRSRPRPALQRLQSALRAILAPRGQVHLPQLLAALSGKQRPSARRAAQGARTQRARDTQRPRLASTRSGFGADLVPVLAQVVGSGRWGRPGRAHGARRQQARAADGQWCAYLADTAGGVSRTGALLDRARRPCRERGPVQVRPLAEDVRARRRLSGWPERHVCGTMLAVVAADAGEGLERGAVTGRLAADGSCEQLLAPGPMRLFALVSYSPTARMSDFAPATPRAADRRRACWRPGRASRVAAFTLLSVVCAESMTATSSSKGVAYRSSVVGVGFAALSRRKIAARVAGCME